MTALLLTNLGNITAEFAGVAASLGIFGISRYISVPVGGAMIWYLVVRGNYRLVEKVFLAACAIYLAYVISGILARPDWSAVMEGIVQPQMKMDLPYLVMLVGIVGTTIAPWMQFYQQSTIVEKEIKVEHYRYVRWDVIIGCVFAAVVVVFIIIACAATLHVNNIRIETAEDAAVALAPLVGNYASFLFALGLANASLFAASILPLSTAYSVCEGMGWEAGINKSFHEAPQFIGLYTGLIIIGGALVLLPEAPLIHIMLISQVINGILLPFILIFILLLVNKKALMGRHVNPPWYNKIVWVAVVLLIILNVMLLAMMVQG
jgi:Mn2+/Fe2+ NRAMP family transporter